MNGIEFRCKREYLGLSAGWIARALNIHVRTVQRWETMAAVPENAAQVITQLYDGAAHSVSVIAVNQLKARTSSSELPPLRIPAGDSQLPASWHRMIAMRVAERTGQEIIAA